MVGRHGFDIVLHGAWTGGLPTVGHVLSALPPDFSLRSLLATPQSAAPEPHRPILGRRTRPEVREAEDGVKVLPSTMSIAPPDDHALVVFDGSLSLWHSEPVHFVRGSRCGVREARP